MVTLWKVETLFAAAALLFTPPSEYTDPFQVRYFSPQAEVSQVVFQVRDAGHLPEQLGVAVQALGQLCPVEVQTLPGEGFGINVVIDGQVSPLFYETVSAVSYAGMHCGA